MRLKIAANLLDKMALPSLLLVLSLITGKAAKLPIDEFNQPAIFGRIAPFARIV